MKKKQKIFFHAFCFLLLAFVFCSLQSVLWFQIFGNFTAPFFSFILFVYFGLDKDSWKSLIYCYSLVYFYSLFTYTSLGMLYFSSMVTFIFLLNVKNRVYWPGAAYFTIMTAISLFLFHITYIITSVVFEARLTPLLLGHRFLQILLTAAVSYFLYSFIKKIDNALSIEKMGEVHGENHG